MSIMECVLPSNHSFENKSSLPTINIIGAGRIGQTLGRLITANNCGIIRSVLSSSFQQSQTAVDFIGQGVAVESIQDIPPANIVFISSPDEKIKFICDQLCANCLLMPGTVLVHFSGIENLEALAAGRKRKCHLARVHPIKHITAIKEAVNQFAGTFCVIEADDSAYGLLHGLFTTIQARVLRINQQEDSVYHTACVFGTVFPQILLSACSMLYQACGMEKKTAINLSKKLMLTVLEQIDETKCYQDFIEGPIKRGDHLTLSKNINSIKNLEIKKIYQALSKLGIGLTDHNEQLKTELKNVATES